MAKKHTVNKKNLGEWVAKLERKLTKARKEYERKDWLYQDGKVSVVEINKLYNEIAEMERDLKDLRALHESWHDNPTFIAIEI